MRPVIRYRSQLLFRKSHKVDRNIRIRVRPRADKGVAFQASCPRTTGRLSTVPD